MLSDYEGGKRFATLIYLKLTSVELRPPSLEAKPQVS